MANYVGVHCPVCGKRFADGDDIVVCPICGAPHHRACYLQTGHCALEELHIKGGAWEPPEGHTRVRDEGEAPEEAVCPSCGAHNPKSGIFCQVCGAPLARRQPGAGAPPFGNPFAQGAPAQESAYTAAFGGLSPEEKIEGESARDLALYIGDNSRYFLPRFKMLSSGAGVTFSWPPLLFHGFYFFYRKMFSVGLAVMLLVMLTYIPEFFTLREQAAYMMQNLPELLSGEPVAEFVQRQHLWTMALVPVMSWMRILLLAALSVFANRLYMRAVLQKVREIRAQFTDAAGKVDDAAYVQALSKQGRTLSVGAMAGIVAAYFLVMTGIQLFFMFFV